MNLDAIIARGPRAIPARRNKVKSNEIRRLIIDANNNDVDLNAICTNFQVERPTVVRILKKYAATGLTDKSPQGGIKPNK
jgi:Mn-dependent DtxR family transcriptional regulator